MPVDLSLRIISSVAIALSFLLSHERFSLSPNSRPGANPARSIDSSSRTPGSLWRCSPTLMMDRRSRDRIPEALRRGNTYRSASLARAALLVPPPRPAGAGVVPADLPGQRRHLPGGTARRRAGGGSCAVPFTCGLRDAMPSPAHIGVGPDNSFPSPRPSLGDMGTPLEARPRIGHHCSVRAFFYPLDHDPRRDRVWTTGP